MWSECEGEVLCAAFWKDFNLKYGCNDGFQNQIQHVPPRYASTTMCLISSAWIKNKYRHIYASGLCIVLIELSGCLEQE